jgi:hypothetical protein
MDKTRLNLAIILSLGLVATLSLFACDKKENDKLNINNALIGEWVDTVNALPSVYYIDGLIFNLDATFTQYDSAFGIYNVQKEDDLSGWFVRRGKFYLDGEKIRLIVHNTISWDSFYGRQPETVNQEAEIFEYYTYKVNAQVFRVEYITYPADGPVNTKKQYKKLSK